MSGYIPTTEEVRKAWADWVATDWLATEQFYRWLAEVKKQEAKAERERIKQRLWDDGYLYEMERDHVWALIEGENSE